MRCPEAIDRGLPPSVDEEWDYRKLAARTGTDSVHLVESRMGASTDAEAPPRFPSPLIKPDVPN
jgi:hypothetical protein